MTTAMTKSGPPQYGGANGSVPRDSVTIRCIVTQTNTDWGSGRVVIHRCTAGDVETGISTKDLPCAGMDLQPGDMITVTVHKQNEELKLRSERSERS